jgi:protein-S-isoprenylcysteine O-methyltransferase Ste14
MHYHNGEFSWQNWPGYLGQARYAPLPVSWAMVGLTFVGFAFAWWARIHLGRLWSGRITRKEGHHVVDTGPYALVRHPIYTGILLSGIATAVALGAVHAYIGAFLLIVGYWMKARIEENWLREQLGPADYDAYRKRVPMLVPFGPKAA